MFKKSLIIFFLFFSLLLNGKEKEAPKENEDPKEKKNEIGWVVFPIAFYSSDTSLGFGASAVLFKDHHEIDGVAKSNSFATVAFYTLRNQLLNANVGNIYWDKANWHWRGKLLISKYPTDFYGIGKYSKESDGEVFEPFSFEFENDIQYRLIGSLYGGMSLVQGYYKLLKNKNDGLAEKYFEDNRKEGFISGLGIKLNYDSRDDSFYPTKGLLLEATYRHFFSALGSKYEFAYYKVDLRGYIATFLNSVIALQLYFNAVDGKAPLSILPALGSQDLLRGYPAGRYRDNYYLAGQTELRFPIYWRFGGVLFFGAGKVQEQLTEFFFKDLKIAGGFGLRFQMSKDKKINFRFDMGFTPEGFSFYFNLLEAF
jgi:outer membrane protein assembly factor BamA